MSPQAWIDNSLLLVSVIVSLIAVRKLKGRTVSVVTGFFLLFPSMLVFLNMWGHTVAVLITNYQRYLKGTFHYSFHFYALLLLGLTGIGVSGLIIHYSRKLARGYSRYRPTVYTLHLITAVLFLPVGFINPLGFLPVMAAIVSAVTLLLNTQNPKKKPVTRVTMRETVSSKVS